MRDLYDLILQVTRCHLVVKLEEFISSAPAAEPSSKLIETRLEFEKQAGILRRRLTRKKARTELLQLVLSAQLGSSATATLRYLDLLQ